MGTVKAARVPPASSDRIENVPRCVFTISLGTAGGTIEENGTTVRVPPDPTVLRHVASASGGRFYRAADAKAVESAYRDIGSAVKPHHEKRDISVAFVAGAAVLVLAGSLLSLAWFRRLI